ncbi:peptidase M23 [Listeria monocytogenes]|uniref:M23 family metallopeptidase n=1 Tax=Listeria welshimeri TaxID=1643 RepID=UPI000FB2688E|nr:M23 family metallopeptidase [Listeria welshimeri]MBF2612551.1 peptidoglycan DD-metalloendopeptidase family protein [Listeria welshimeri]MDZ06795.1 peptidase M23 [Listeria monocytogenes]
MKKMIIISAIVILLSIILIPSMAILFLSNDDSDSVKCSAVSGTLTESSLEAYLEDKGVFKGHAKDFFEYGSKYDVDPALVVAICMSETGRGTSAAVVKRNNPGGLMGNGGGFSFDTLKQGIEAMIENLSRNYIKMGLTTPETIQPKYCPVGASNDPTGLNSNWLITVNFFLDELGGLSCESVASGTGSYIIPVKNPQVSSGFSDRVNPVTGIQESHKGLDFAQQIGTEILAADDGIVVFSGYGASGSGFGGYGNVVLIEHKKNKEWTLYGHQSMLLVKNNQKVKQGQVIGKVGSTGQSTGPHLHFEIRKEKMGAQVDPAPILGLN